MHVFKSKSINATMDKRESINARIDKRGLINVFAQKG